MGAVEKVDGLTADHESHHIEGYAVAAVRRGLDGAFSCPLITEIAPDLWMGGCRDGVKLPEGFTFVLSLYPGEKYVLPGGCFREEVRMWDTDHIEPGLDAIASRAYEWTARPGSKVLIHCQAGLNRSGLLTALVLMKGGMPALNAIDLLREKRSPMVLCNETFERYLLELGA